MKHIAQHMRVLSVDPTRRGFAYAVLEARGRLVDWGTTRIPSKNEKEFVARVEELVLRYLPVSIILEGASIPRRSARARQQLEALIAYLRTNQMGVVRVSRASVRAGLGMPRATKREVAVLLSEAFTELRPYLPPARKPWMSEDDRMNIFDALALAVAVVGLPEGSSTH